jgi:hypothetical protein
MTDWLTVCLTSVMSQSQSIWGVCHVRDVFFSFLFHRPASKLAVRVLLVTSRLVLVLVLNPPQQIDINREPGEIDNNNSSSAWGRDTMMQKGGSHLQDLHLIIQQQLDRV